MGQFLYVRFIVHSGSHSCTMAPRHPTHRSTGRASAWLRRAHFILARPPPAAARRLASRWAAQQLSARGPNARKMSLILKLLGQALGGTLSALGRLAISLVIACAAIASMIFAAIHFGVYGLVAVAVPVVLALFILGYVYGGSEGSSSD